METMELTNSPNLAFVSGLKEKMEQHHFLLSFRGVFTHSITKSILAMAEKKMDGAGSHLTVRKKVFTVMVECLQNICGKNPTDSANAFFMVGKKSDNYIINSGNIIKEQNVEQLKKSLENINLMKKDELREVYKTMIVHGQANEEDAAVLSLIDIAKKTGGRLYYDFQPVGKGYSFFSLSTKIKV
jgi:hypothetical protein